MKDIVVKTIMLKGEAGSSITKIEKTGSSGVVDTYTIYFDDDKAPFSFDVTNGYSIISIEKTSTLGNIDTYTVTLDNGDTYTFDVTNGNVANSMIAQDESIVAPSIEATKDYINNVSDNEGLLFCGDFVNIPTSSLFEQEELPIPRTAHYGLGWVIPAWLIFEEGKGLKVDKTYSGTFDGLYSPKYHNRNVNLSTLGVNKVIVSVEWSKEGESTIHTSTKVVTDTDVNYAYTIVELEPNILLKITSFLGETTSDDFGGTTRFGILTNGNTIQGDYYIRKIKMEKGEIATPFSMNKSQFYALQVFTDFTYTMRNRYQIITGNADFDSSGEVMFTIPLPSGFYVNNTFVMSVRYLRLVNDEFEEYFGIFNGSSYTGNVDVDLGFKTKRINGADYLVIYIKDVNRAGENASIDALIYKHFDYIEE